MPTNPTKINEENDEPPMPKNKLKQAMLPSKRQLKMLTFSKRCTKSSIYKGYRRILFSWDSSRFFFYNLLSHFKWVVPELNRPISCGFFVCFWDAISSQLDHFYVEKRSWTTKGPDRLGFHSLFQQAFIWFRGFQFAIRPWTLHSLNTLRKIID